MNLQPAAMELLCSFWWCLPLCALVFLATTPWAKGLMGEAIVNLCARFMLDKKRYRLVKNVTLPAGDGTTQIDHIIVSVYGIFVVETKNMRGWIFGSENDREWTQSLGKKRKIRFQNPLRQNHKHTRTLAELLAVPPSSIISVIAFVGNSTFKKKMPENVTQGVGCIRYIKQHTTPLFTEEEVEAMVKTIAGGRLKPSLQTSRRHVAHVRNIVEEKRKSPKCPKCGRPMVEKTAKRGKNAGNAFWGCPAFPRCSGTRKLTEQQKGQR